MIKSFVKIGGGGNLSPLASCARNNEYQSVDRSLTGNYLLVLFLFSTLFAVSCSKVPEGMPKTYPCTIKVVNGSEPIIEANIVLHAETPIADVVSSGITDTSGSAKIASLYKNYQAKGAPEGSYKVTITKLAFVAHTKTPEEITMMSPGDQIAYEKEFVAKREALPKIVPDELTKVSETPLTVDVTSKGGVLEVDLSKYF